MQIAAERDFPIALDRVSTDIRLSHGGKEVNRHSSSREYQPVNEDASTGV